MLSAKNPYNSTISSSTIANSTTSTISDHRIICPTRSGVHLQLESAVLIPAHSAEVAPAGVHEGVTRRVVRGVEILEVSGSLGRIVDDLDRTIQLALADGPRGVVCDLSAVFVSADEPRAVEVLATAGRHVRDWPGVPVAVACPDPKVRAALAAHPLGGQLIVTSSVFSAVSMVLLTPDLAVERIQLALHPSAVRASCDFVTRTLQDWGLASLVLSANLVVSELVSSATTDAATDIELTVAWYPRALRLGVRDDIAGLAPHRHSRYDPSGRRRSVVVDLSRAFGVLPTVDGGRVAWAVLNAVRTRPVVTPTYPDRFGNLAAVPVPIRGLS